MDRLRVLVCAYRDWALELAFWIRDCEIKKVTKPKLLLRAFNIFQPNVVLLLGWSWIVPKEIYGNCPTICLHPSPLPKYRGGCPIQHQIINGEKRSAITLFKVTRGIDEGNILAREEFSLEGTLDDIFKRITVIGIILVNRVLKLYPNFDGIPQTGITTTYIRRRPEESEIKIEDFQNKTAEELYNFIRALDDPYPNAFIKCKQGKLYLKRAKYGT